MKLFDNRPLEEGINCELTRNQKVCESAVSFRGNLFCPRPNPPTVYNLRRGDLNYCRFAISSRRGGVYVTRDNEKEKIAKIPSGRVMKSRKRSKVSRHALKPFDGGRRERKKDNKRGKEENEGLESVTRWFTTTPRRSEPAFRPVKKNEICLRI